MNTTRGQRGQRGKFNARRKSSGSSFGGRKTFGKGSRNSGGRSAFRGGRGQGGGARKMPTFDPSKFIQTLSHTTTEAAPLTEEYAAVHTTFAAFNLDTRLVKTVADNGIDTPTPIQDQIIPEILNGNDVIGIAETGTGKTAAFLLPLIHTTVHNTGNLTLVMAPTRELALQIDQELRKLGKGLNLFSTVCVGGVNIRPQIKALHRKNHFVIGTPGRILDLVKRGDLKLGNVTNVVLDEADRMLDMGFIGDMRSILGATPKDRMTLFFSATMDAKAEALVHDFMRNPVTILVKKKDSVDGIAQDIVSYTQDSKFETLLTLLKSEEYKKVIIFGAMKHSVKKLAIDLTKNGVKAESIHGNKSHSQRQNTLRLFKSGKADVLVATDVAARGIHVDDVTHVINYDLPGTFEDYIHRIGRTGRAEKRGSALTFVQKKSY